MGHNRINALIVDDEIEACNNLSYLLTNYFEKQINISGVANSTKEAEEKIKLLKPEIIFLDIEMPNENAFQFLMRLGKIDFEIIFITAYDEYAIRAFKLNALGYILKPIDIEELEKVISILQERILFNKLLSKHSKEGMIDLIQKIDQKEQQTQLILSDTNHWETVSFSNIMYVQASGSYSKIYYINKAGITSRILSKAINEYENLLPEKTFFRVHKSYLINCIHIKTIQKGENREIILNDGSIIPIGRRRFTEFLEFVKQQPPQ